MHGVEEHSNDLKIKTSMSGTKRKFNTNTSKHGQSCSKISTHEKDA